MLRDLGITSVRLMSNNPKKLEGLTGQGIAVNERLPHEIVATSNTHHYLKTKKTKMGHFLSSV
jgi:GTP cyclohydrolase II